MAWHRRIHQRVRSEMSYVSSQCSQTDEPTSQIMGGRPRVLRASTYRHRSLPRSPVPRFIDAYSKWVDVLPISAYPHRPLSPLCVQSSSMWEFLLPWCQITARTLSPTNSKLFCLITSSAHVRTPRVIISRMVWWNASSKNLRFILNSVMQPARRTFRALLPHFAYIITPPRRLTGAVPNSFVFQHVTRTRLSAQCTERDQPHAPEPVFVRVEHQKPVPGFVSAKVGTNTSLDSRGRLVHDADVMARQRTGEDKFNEQDAEPPEEIPALHRQAQRLPQRLAYRRSPARSPK